MRLRTTFLAIAAAAALLVGCTAGGDSGSSSDTTSSSGGSSGTTTVPTGPAPGVTDDSIKIGVEFVDLSTLGDIATLDHGDVGGAYQALFDEINANGGINGRMLDPTIIGINPVGTDSAEAACTRLTQDEQVFVVVGFFQGDAVLCPLETHQTAVIGGQMTPQRLQRAQAPWFTTESGTDLQGDIIQAMIDAGEFDGTVGIFAATADEDQVNDDIVPLLDDAGIDVVDTAILQQNGDEVDIVETNRQVGIIAQRFESEGIDQVIIPGQSGLTWAGGVEGLDYRPQLFLTDPGSIQAYANDPAGRDLSVLDEAVGGGPYGTAENVWSLPQMQDCISTVVDAGIPVPEPDSLPADSGAVYIAGTESCTNVALMQALLEAAGPDLNYGTLAAGADGLVVDLPNQPDPVTYGPPPSADGDVPAFLYDWDPDTGEFTLRE